MNSKQFILNLINSNIRNKAPKVIKSEHADVEEALLEAIFIPYEVKQLDCPAQFILDNFDLETGPNMGLGKNLMLGFAMSNGNNGTQDRRKRTSVGFDPRAFVSGNNFSIIGNKFGSETHTLTIPELPSHDHPLSEIGRHTSNNTGHPRSFFDQGYGGDTDGKTDEVGGDVGHNNVQPSIVTLFVQRIEI